MNIFAKKAICTWLSALTVLSSLPALTVSGSENETDRFMLGDITQDGKITLKDSSFVQRACIELEKPSEQQLILGNVDAKEGLQLKDAYLIQHYVLGFDSDYPVNDRGLSIGDDIDFDAYNIDTDNSDIDTDSITDTDTSYSTDSATDTDTSASTDSETLEVTFECENTCSPETVKQARSTTRVRVRSTSHCITTAV